MFRSQSQEVHVHALHMKKAKRVTCFCQRACSFLNKDMTTDQPGNAQDI